MIKKVVVPAAGMGTRLFPATKELPKEMLPIFSRLANVEVSVKPLLQMAFEQLCDGGFSEFCFVVGKGKRSIEDHFTPDPNSVLMLRRRGMKQYASDLSSFYAKLRSATIFWVNQPEPKGFGDAVLLSRPFVQDEPFLVYAGDTYIISNKTDYLSLMVKVHERFKADATFLVQEAKHPRKYGIIEGDEIEPSVYRVRHAVEKPEKPRTNLAIVAVYAFQPKIFKALKKTTPGKEGEIQLTDAIQRLIDSGSKVYAITLDQGAKIMDIGSPETYWEALSLSYESFCKDLKQDDES